MAFTSHSPTQHPRWIRPPLRLFHPPCRYPRVTRSGRHSPQHTYHRSLPSRVGTRSRRLIVRFAKQAGMVGLLRTSGVVSSYADIRARRVLWVGRIMLNGGRPMTARCDAKLTLISMSRRLTIALSSSCVRITPFELSQTLFCTLVHR